MGAKRKVCYQCEGSGVVHYDDGHHGHYGHSTPCPNCQHKEPSTRSYVPFEEELRLYYPVASQLEKNDGS